MPRFHADDVEVLDDKLVWRGFYQMRQLSLRHRLFSGGWGEPISRELFVRPAAVGVLPYDPELDCILQIEQFRVGATNRGSSPWLLEIVAGLIDKDESPEQVARREAEEEAGIVLQEMESIADYFSSPGASDEYFHLYCARADLASAGGIHGLPEEGEDIRAEVLPFDVAWALVESGSICNAHSLLAMYWLRQHRERLRELWRR